MSWLERWSGQHLTKAVCSVRQLGCLLLLKLPRLRLPRETLPEHWCQSDNLWFGSFFGRNCQCCSEFQRPSAYRSPTVLRFAVILCSTPVAYNQTRFTFCGWVAKILLEGSVLQRPERASSEQRACFVSLHCLFPLSFCKQLPWLTGERQFK